MVAFIFNLQIAIIEISNKVTYISRKKHQS